MPRDGETKVSQPHPPGMGGEQHLYGWPNGYGASVIRFAYSYGGDKGLWELAVLRRDSNGQHELDYTTPITNDVVGYLSWEQVNALLDQIAALPPHKEATNAT